MHRFVTVQCPATVANLVCGFDILGMALQAPFDLMEVQLLDEPAIRVSSRDGFPLPTEPALNTAGAPLLFPIGTEKTWLNCATTV